MVSNFRGIHWTRHRDDCRYCGIGMLTDITDRKGVEAVRSVVSPGYAVAIEEKLSRVPPVMTDRNWSRLDMVNQLSKLPAHWVASGQAPVDTS
mgnify:CR=1 FL=1